jgi:hypothetical protein
MSNKVYIFKPTHPHLIFIYSEYKSSAPDKKADLLALWRSQKYKDAYVVENDAVTALLEESHNICFSKDYVDFMRDYHSVLFPYTPYTSIIEKYMVKQSPSRKGDPEGWACLSDEQRDIISDWYHHDQIISQRQQQKLIKENERKAENSYVFAGIFALFPIALWYELEVFYENTLWTALFNIAARWFILGIIGMLAAAVYKYLNIEDDEKIVTRLFKRVAFVGGAAIFIAIFHNLIS